MPSSINFSATIPTPCLQLWEEMTPSGNGKHCSSCQKKVIDFSLLTDAEIVNIISSSSQKICGRFNAAQLNRTLDKPVEKRNAFPAIMLTTLLVINAPSTSAARPVTIPFIHVPFALPSGLSEASAQQPCDTLRIITGKLIDSTTKDALLSAVVKIKGTSYGTLTDTAGNFRLRIPDSLHQSEVTLVFTYIGYMQKELLVTDNSPLKIEVKMDAQVLGQMDVVVICKAPIQKRLKSKWKKLWGKSK
ncbi:carboxypeptidase-like regulatory domain-containing protein [Chitinophaga sp.]|uniref:carboxypeptidase-like regulatory domain-containing protein n=1 Tax=Chitinophaga sp. TaxID=1869181 RepID=UPI002F933AF5